MTTPQLDRLRGACHRLRLYQVEAELATLLEHAAKREVSYADFLDEVLTREVGAKTEKHLAMRVAMALSLSEDAREFRLQVPAVD